MHRLTSDMILAWQSGDIILAKQKAREYKEIRRIERAKRNNLTVLRSYNIFPKGGK